MLYDRLTFISIERMTPRETALNEHTAPHAAILLYLNEGTLEVRRDYDRWEMHPGQALLVGEHADFVASGGASDFFLLRMSVSFEEQPFILREAADPVRVTRLMNELTRVSTSPDYPEEASDYFARLVVIELARRERQTSETTEDERLFPDVRAYLEAHAADDLTVAGVAAHFGYSPDYLNRGFRTYFGRGLKSTIDAVRLGHIRTCLLDESLDNEDLAEACGFRTYKRLAEFFKYNTGMSISAYRAGKKQ